MTEEKKNHLSRRDALKVLGAAAGATALANLPKKWDSPELLSGVLPAHAQTSVCYAATIEVLSTDGFAEGFSIPWPDELEWDELPGSIVRFYCQTGCLYIELFLVSGTTASYQITTNSQQFTTNVGVDETRYILINMDTGDYALDFGTPPSGCEWIQVEGDAARSNPSRPGFGQ